MRQTRLKLIPTAALFLAGVTGLPLAGQPEAAPQSDSAGFLYGRVETRSGNTYTGVLRWGTQELFWDDLFNSYKEELPYAEQVPKKHHRKDAERVGLMEWVLRLGFDRDSTPSRQFWILFGDIDRIEVGGRDDYAVVVTKGGARFAVSGGGNDVSDPIRVYDTSLGEIDVAWRNIETIQLLPTPAEVPLPGRRLYGRVETESGSFQGFIQWDSEEAISIDKLDGESEDGDLSLEMGKLTSIARNSRTSSRVVLADGRAFDLEGTNDVDATIRGILVEDPRYGRVEIPWDRFVRVDFQPAPGSGPAYASFPPGVPLHGTVTARGGQRHQGRIVFDLDEEYDNEMLNGQLKGLDLYIPFRRVASITRQGRGSSKVQLRNGEALVLEELQDVSDDNAGVVVLPREGGQPVYVAWEEVERVDFE